jgi:hypothetical protein
MIDQHVLNFSPIAGSRLCVAPRKRRSQLPFQVLEPEVFIGRGEMRYASFVRAAYL